MYKIKTNRGAAKRFRRTKSGKFKRANAFARHLMPTKSAKQKRGMRHSSLVSKQDQKNVKEMLPYA